MIDLRLCQKVWSSEMKEERLCLKCLNPGSTKAHLEALRFPQDIAARFWHFLQHQLLASLLTRFNGQAAASMFAMFQNSALYVLHPSRDHSITCWLWLPVAPWAVVNRILEFERRIIYLDPSPQLASATLASGFGPFIFPLNSELLVRSNTSLSFEPNASWIAITGISTNTQ